MDERERSDEFPRQRRFVGLEQRVLARYGSLGCAPGTTVLVGFSGGADSLALAGVLAKLAQASDFRVVALHVDHGLRTQSGEEQGRAGELAAALGVPFLGRRLIGEPRALHPGVGVEEAARRERYRLYADVAARTGAGLVALGHRREDQAETVLLHLVRGAGLDGASGMGERTRLEVPWWQAGKGHAVDVLDVWRPFLSESKEEVRAYVATLGIEPIEDPSNEDRTLRRNAIRHDVLPVLENVIPGATGALARFAGLAADDARALDSIAWEAFRGMVTEDGVLLWEPFRREERVAVARRIVRFWVQERMGYGSMPAERVDAVMRLREQRGSGRRVEVGEHLVVVTGREGLRIERGGRPVADGAEGVGEP